VETGVLRLFGLIRSDTGEDARVHITIVLPRFCLVRATTTDTRAGDEPGPLARIQHHVFDLLLDVLLIAQYPIVGLVEPDLAFAVEQLINAMR
jgi:hypothetical protein